MSMKDRRFLNSGMISCVCAVIALTKRPIMAYSTLIQKLKFQQFHKTEFCFLT